MPYEIELMSVGENIYPLLQESAEALNRIQDEFRFFPTPESKRGPGLGLRFEKYKTQDIWDFLKAEREKGGRRPFIIAFVTKPLGSDEWNNLFGSHQAENGLAVVTTHNSVQYVKEETRYCRYYLTRYAMSFVNPKIRSHGDDARKSCYFHFKQHRPDIRISMDSGSICDPCTKQLENPVTGANRLSDEERDALLKMRQFVSGDFPHAIVMKGGGVKGLAFAGALLELEKHFWFNQHVGTSAGAIAAILLAADYRPAELAEILTNKNFKDFLDAKAWRFPVNLAIYGGLYPGEAFRIWIAKLLGEKVKQLSEIRMSQLNGALVYASRRGGGLLRFDSRGERKDTPADFAVRCSMSIPYFFQPMDVDGRPAYDGGARANFPLKQYIDDYPSGHFIGLYLGKPDHRNRLWSASELLDIVIEGDERAVADKHSRDVVVIDTSPIGTVDFGLTSVEKDFLLKIGRSSALRFLLNRKLDDGPRQADVEYAEREAEAARNAVFRLRGQKRERRALWTVAILAILGILCFAGFAI